MIQPEHDQRPADDAATWHTLRTHHASLGDLANRLEARLGSLARSAAPPDPAEVSEAGRLLDEFRRLLREHLDLEERAGFVEHAADAAPELQRWIERLRREHAGLRARVDALCDVGPATDWVRLHAGFAAFARTLADHERSENDLLHRAHLEDLGGSG